MGEKMLIGWKENGFEITCKVMPESCADCPFLTERFKGDMIPNAALCFLTGSEFVVGKHAKMRQSDCPLKQKNGKEQEYNEAVSIESLSNTNQLLKLKKRHVDEDHT